MDGSKLLTVDDLCRWLNVAPIWVYAQTREKRIPFLKIGKYLRFERHRIEKWLKNNSQES